MGCLQPPLARLLRYWKQRRARNFQILEANELFASPPRPIRGNPYAQESAQPLEAPDHACVDGVLDANQIRRGVVKRLLFALFDFLAETARAPNSARRSR